MQDLVSPADAQQLRKAGRSHKNQHPQQTYGEIERDLDVLDFVAGIVEMLGQQNATQQRQRHRSNKCTNATARERGMDRAQNIPGDFEKNGQIEQICERQQRERHRPSQMHWNRLPDCA